MKPLHHAALAVVSIIVALPLGDASAQTIGCDKVQAYCQGMLPQRCVSSFGAGSMAVAAEDRTGCDAIAVAYRDCIALLTECSESPARSAAAPGVATATNADVAAMAEMTKNGTDISLFGCEVAGGALSCRLAVTTREDRRLEVCLHDIEAVFPTGASAQPKILTIADERVSGRCSGYRNFYQGVAVPLTLSFDAPDGLGSGAVLPVLAVWSATLRGVPVN